MSQLLGSTWAFGLYLWPCALRIQFTWLPPSKWKKIHEHYVKNQISQINKQQYGWNCEVALHIRYGWNCEVVLHIRMKICAKKVATQCRDSYLCMIKSSSKSQKILLQRSLIKLSWLHFLSLLSKNALDDPRHQHFRVMNFWTKMKMIKVASNQDEPFRDTRIADNNSELETKKHVAANQLTNSIINWVNITFFIILDIKIFVFIPFHQQRVENQVEQGLECQPP